MLARGLQRVAAWLQCRIEPHDSAARKLSGNHPRPRRLALQGCTCRPDSRQRAVKIPAKGIVTDMRRLKFAPVAVAVADMVAAPNLAQAGGVGLPPAAAKSIHESSAGVTDGGAGIATTGVTATMDATDIGGIGSATATGGILPSALGWELRGRWRDRPPMHTRTMPAAVVPPNSGRLNGIPACTPLTAATRKYVRI